MDCKPPPFCPKGHGQMVLRQSKSERNPGRLYYICPLNEKHEGFIKWWDIHQGMGWLPPDLVNKNVHEPATSTCPACSNKKDESANEESASSGKIYATSEPIQEEVQISTNMPRMRGGNIETGGVFIPMFHLTCLVAVFAVFFGITLGYIMSRLL